MTAVGPAAAADASSAAGAPPQPRVTGPAGNRRWWEVALFVTWLAVVVYLALHHEFWRDEVRALSLVRAAGSPVELVRLIGDDGHPVLWYLLLWLPHAVAHTPLVLPVVSLVVGAAAAALFLWRAPFPLWLRALFLFGALGLYEYVVMARNYGISALLLFTVAALYPRRAERPFLLAAALALLANTNAHSVGLVLLLAAVWSWDTVAAHRTLAPGALGRRLYAPLLVVLAAVAFSAAVIVPDSPTIVTDAPTLGGDDVLRSLVSTALRPAERFDAVVPRLPGPVDQLLLYVAVLGLLPRLPLFLAGLGALLGLGVFFDLVYAGAYRHEGLFVVFLLTLYWMLLDGRDRAAMPRARRRLVGVGLYGAVAPLLAIALWQGWQAAARDVRHELSGSPALGAWLAASPRYRDAVVLPEPGFLIESLPYYADNPIYLPREGRYANTASFTTRSQQALTLDELVTAARQVRRDSGRPVLIALGYWDLETDREPFRWLSYGQTFAWSRDQVARLHEAAALVAEFGDAVGDERFRVYELR